MRVSYLDAAILNLPECEGVEGFDCCFPATVFNVDARQFHCDRHFDFWQRNCQGHDPYKFGQLAAPQTLVEYVIEYMQKQGM